MLLLFMVFMNRNKKQWEIDQISYTRFLCYVLMKLKIYMVEEYLNDTYFS